MSALQLIPEVHVSRPDELLGRRFDGSWISCEDSSVPTELAGAKAAVVRLPDGASIAALEAGRPDLSGLEAAVLVVPRDLVDRLQLAVSHLGLAVRRRGILPGPEPANVANLVVSTAFVVRSLRDDDIDDVLGLFAPSFHASRTRAHWHWKFDENLWRECLVSIARHEDGDLAAHYAGYPTVFFDAASGRRIPALQIGDTMTAPEFRSVGRGHTSLLVRTVLHFYAAHCTGRVGFNYGFNTGNIRRFSFRFLGVRPVQPVPLRILQLDGAPLTSRRRYRISRTRRASRAFDRLFRRAAPSYGVLIERGARWLDWRYLRCPDEPPFELYTASRWGRLRGWIVVRRNQDRILWCDALTTPEAVDCTPALLARAIGDHEERAGVHPREVAGWFPDRPEWWSRQLVDLGFESAPDPDDLGMACVPHETADAVELLQRSYFTWGDSDLA